MHPSPHEERVPGPRRRFPVVLAVLALAVVALGGCNLNPAFGAPRGITTQAHEVFKLWWGMVVAGLAVAALVWGLIFWSVVRYRRKKGDNTLPRQFQEHIPLELVYTIVPIIMVGVIFGFTFVVENNVDSVAAKPAVVVNVTAYQWGWIFQYAHTGVTVKTAANAAPSSLPKDYFSPLYPQLVLPEGETTRIFLRSNDVIHGFYVNALNFSRYAQPGVVNEFQFTPTTTGRYTGQCTQYCGLYHSEMLFSVRIVTPAQYHTWLSSQQATSATQARVGTA